jgi:hypothetical protein
LILNLKEMFGASQKTGLNSSQYDFKGVAVITIINSRLDLLQVPINQLNLEQVLVHLPLPVDQHPLVA